MQFVTDRSSLDEEPLAGGVSDRLSPIAALAIVLVKISQAATGLDWVLATDAVVVSSELFDGSLPPKSIYIPIPTMIIRATMAAIMVFLFIINNQYN